jgi:transposase
LAKLRDRRCSKIEQEIAEQLSGHWREDHLFSLQQALTMYDAVQERIAPMKGRFCGSSARWKENSSGAKPRHLCRTPTKQERSKNAGKKRQALYRMSGVHATQIEVVLSEFGPDLSRFPGEKQFVAHTTLAPHGAKTGGKPIKKKKRNSTRTRVAAALRMAALSLRHSQTALGAYYRKIAQRKGGDIAVFATARKLAILIYRLLRWGPYVDEAQPPTKIAITSNALDA